MTASPSTAVVPPNAAERRTAVFAALRAALVTRGHVLCADTLERVDGIYVDVQITEERARHSTIRPSGRLRLTFDGYGDTKQFPEPKAGFDVAKIAGEIGACVAAKMADRVRSEERTQRVDAARALAAKINAEVTGARGCTARVSFYGALYVQVDRACTEEQTRKLLAATAEIFGVGVAS